MDFYELYNDEFKELKAIYVEKGRPGEFKNRYNHFLEINKMFSIKPDLKLEPDEEYDLLCDIIRWKLIIKEHPRVEIVDKRRKTYYN